MSAVSAPSPSNAVVGHDEAFLPFPLRHGPLTDLSGQRHPVRLAAWSDGPLQLAEGFTHFGVVFGGVAALDASAGTFALKAGMYFSVCGPAVVNGRGQGFVISTPTYKGFFQIGGPVESSGRLNYIDGCTDSLLVPPILKGDPCLNLLCFPPGIDQTPHTHPSLRAGLVISGTGYCRTNRGLIPLTAGMAFAIPENQLHSFITEDEPMRVIAYHPDSDFGATHQDHPMINRTMVNGVSASRLSHLQTR